MRMPDFTISFNIQKKTLDNIRKWLDENALRLIIVVLALISVFFFDYYYQNGLGLAYNDARSHLDIGRRVVEGLKPGIAQLGSVWLPLPHVLMIPTIWSDFMWHSGLAGAIVSMASFVVLGVVIYKFLEELGAGMLARLFGVLVFIANVNILYLQSTAMTELLLMVTMTTGAYYLMLWAKTDKILNLIKSAFFIMLSTVTRYDGWFLLLVATLIIAFNVFKKKGYQETEGKVILFVTLGSLGIALWFFWNLLIFGDSLYFAFGPFSAKAQQDQLDAAGDLHSKYNLLLSIKIYLYALVYNSYAYQVFLGFFGFVALWKAKIKYEMKVAAVALLAPLFFNVLALFMGHSVLFVQGISGNTWFNVRYGIMLLPSIAVFAGFLVERLKNLRWVIIGLFIFVAFFAFANTDAVTIDDAKVGSSQKNVSEVSGWLAENAASKKGFVLISAASHDAIIFSSGMQMKRFIHEGTGLYWESATTSPDRWARWIVMRTHDDNDLTWMRVSESDALEKYNLVDSYPFADIYELDQKYLSTLNTEPVFGKHADIKKQK